MKYSRHSSRDGGRDGSHTRDGSNTRDGGRDNVRDSFIWFWLALLLHCHTDRLLVSQLFTGEPFGSGCVGGSKYRA